MTLAPSMPSAARTPIDTFKPRPTADAMLSIPWLRDARIGDSTFGQVLSQQVHFGFEGAGAFSERSIVPRSQAAADLLAGARGTQVTANLRGVLSILDGKEAIAKLDGLSVPTTRGGFLVNATLAYMEELDPEVTSLPRTDPDGSFRKQYEAMWQQQMTLDDGGAWDAPYGWVNVGTPDGGHVLAMLRGDPTTDTQLAGELTLGFGHELQHRVSPPTLDADYDDRLAWLEESAASLLSIHHAKLNASKLGLPFDQHQVDELAAQGTPGYLTWRQGLEKLLDVAQVDVSTSAGLVQADTLLQSSPVVDVPARLAARIARSNQLSQDFAESLPQAIMDTEGKADRVDQLVSQITAAAK